MAEEQGLVHIYYGDGKGKTTAAFGLALRCAGQGRRVVVAQFLKNGGSGECTALARLPEITVLHDKPVQKFTFQMDEQEKALTAEHCLSLFCWAVSQAAEQRAGLLVLDEVLDALGGFLPADALTGFLDRRPAGLEVVLTGHTLPQTLADRADYITHLVKERHPYDRGIQARRGVEF